jgi:phospholipid-binding lipoprotein MlaA
MPSIAAKFLRLPAALALIAVVSLSGCATPPTDPDELAQYKENNDPLEPMNRYFFEVNYALDELFFKPVASWYDTILPTPVEHSVHNFLRNMNGPVILANDLLQGNMKRAGITAKRFLINTTLGVGGLFDVAADWFDLKYHDEDFGQTLAVWGSGEGPYLVVPILGPSNPRDLVGKGVDSFIDPWGWVFRAEDVAYLSYVRAGLEGIDLRARNLDTLDAIRKGAVDYYATIRSLYRQNRNDAIKNGATGDEPLASMPYSSPADETPSDPQVTQTN